VPESQPWRVLVADPVARHGIEILERVAQVDVRTGQPPEALVAAIGDYDALIVRSETRVTAAVIAAAKRLQVVGRAGVGVDNIDIPSATAAGVVVVNAPTGNTISAAEHTIGLMLALARHIPQANASLRAGKWERSKFIGTEVRGKTLVVLGVGQVGSEVVRRAVALGMRVVGFDPFLTEERARILGVELAGSLEDALPQADFLSVHTTLTSTTRGLIGEAELARMKPSARVLNTARGGIIEEDSLLDAVRSGRIAGAAIDVFTKEPAPDTILAGDDRIVVTPHLGASTEEAQERVAVDVAEQVVDVLEGRPARYAVNAPMVPPETMAVVGPYLDVALMAGSLATQLSDGQLADVSIEYRGDIAEHDTTVLRAGVIRGLLAPISEENVTVVNAGLIAEKRGLRIDEHKSTATDGYPNLLQVRLRTNRGVTSVGGTIEHGNPHIVLINDLLVDIAATDAWLLICDNQDRPGTIGAVGTLLGSLDLNISSMRVGRTGKRGRALMVLEVDEPLTEDHLEAVRRLPNIESARIARLQPRFR
jgi:D-3-phosphoglycerate dehydrogenase